ALASQKEAAPARNSRHYSAGSHGSAVWLLGACFSLAAAILAPAGPASPLQTLKLRLLPRSRPELMLNPAFPISLTAGHGAPVPISVASSSLPGDIPHSLPPAHHNSSPCQNGADCLCGIGGSNFGGLLLPPRKQMVLPAGEPLPCSSKDQKLHPTLGGIGAVDAKRPSSRPAAPQPPAPRLLWPLGVLGAAATPAWCPERPRAQKHDKKPAWALVSPNAQGIPQLDPE
uniref:Uncharacterized protein n=1 Tax=Zonotrichia albicollis TaxID=44394 RepID=A0A8D2QCH2_ZONAL